MLYLREEVRYPKLQALRFNDWYVPCDGNGRTCRLLSEHPVVSCRRTEANDRSLILFNEEAEELNDADRFDPDAYETDNVWSFAAGRDRRLIAPRQRVREVLYGDDERFEIGSAFDVLSGDQGGRAADSCLPMKPLGLPQFA